MDSDDDLLAHGVLLALDPEAPAAPSISTASPASTTSFPEANADSGLIPTLLASAELLDPEVLLGASEPNAPPRTDGTTGAIAARSKAPATGLGVAGGAGYSGPASAADMTRSSGGAPRTVAKAPVQAPAKAAPLGALATTGSAASKGGSPLSARKPAIPSSPSGTTPVGASRPVGVSMGATNSSKPSGATGAVPRGTPASDAAAPSASAGAKKISRPVGVAPGGGLSAPKLPAGAAAGARAGATSPSNAA